MNKISHIEINNKSNKEIIDSNRLFLIAETAKIKVQSELLKQRITHKESDIHNYNLEKLEKKVIEKELKNQGKELFTKIDDIDKSINDSFIEINKELNRWIRIYEKSENSRVISRGMPSNKSMVSSLKKMKSSVKRMKQFFCDNFPKLRKWLKKVIRLLNDPETRKVMNKSKKLFNEAASKAFNIILTYYDFIKDIWDRNWTKAITSGFVLVSDIVLILGVLTVEVSAIVVLILGIFTFCDAFVEVLTGGSIIQHLIIASLDMVIKICENVLSVSSMLTSTNIDKLLKKIDSIINGKIDNINSKVFQIEKIIIQTKILTEHYTNIARDYVSEQTNEFLQNPLYNLIKDNTFFIGVDNLLEQTLGVDLDEKVKDAGLTLKQVMLT